MTKKEYLEEEVKVLQKVLDGEISESEYLQWKKDHKYVPPQKKVTAEDKKAIPGTLQAVLDAYLNYPREIKTTRGTIIITSRSMIERGEVQISGHTITDPDARVAEGEYIHFGYKKRMRVPNKTANKMKERDWNWLENGIPATPYIR